ncbi:MAG: sodium:proton antiporter [Planctomycetaceae bacterium]|nr:sodium:proton antiporter [Planctomycetaceae bacterium]
MTVSLLLLLQLSQLGDPSSAEIEDLRSRLKIHVDTPAVLVRNVPVSKISIRIESETPQLVEAISPKLSLRNVRMTVKGKEVVLPAFDQGQLELTSDLASGTKLYVDGPLDIEFGSSTLAARPVRLLSGWTSLIPPLLAVALAIILRNVFVALFAAVWTGATLLLFAEVPESSNFLSFLFSGFLHTLDTIILDELVQPDDPGKDHMLITLFTVFLGAMIGVMSRSGATTALVNRAGRLTETRERGQLLTWAMGMVVFFDDYANTLLLGGTMRPVADRLKISREKLAFLIDSTAAPIAGLALVSTWVGFEIGQIEEGFAGIGVEVNAFSLFVESVPYRFYPVFLIAFVAMIAWTGRDFGPMFSAETRSIQTGVLGKGVEQTDDSANEPEPRRPLVRNAVIPIFVLLSLLVAGLWWTGASAIAEENAALADGAEPVAATFRNILGYASGNRVLLASSFLASLVAVGSTLVSRSLTLNEAIDAWIEGAKSMFSALVVLVLAWSIATVCDASHLSTAGFLVESTSGILDSRWLPAISFVLAAAVSFATGSSFSTMGLLMPLSIAVTFQVMGEVESSHPIMLATIGAVLAGSIWGDHCSPISDTTVLSSAAAGCDHLSHVATQFPYACCVAFVALLLGYLPIGVGYTVWLLIPLGIVALYLLVRFVGKKPSS